jgi:chemotaxis methyl-accepting protein methylase
MTSPETPMTNTVQQIAELIQRQSGIALGHSRLPALRAAIARVLPDAASSELLGLLADPRQGPLTLDRLVDEITINETFFMRHRAELDTIPWARLLAQARRRGQSSVRVWSVACSSGEEAYSLAILALAALPGETGPVSVLGTDISQSCLKRATEGRYGERALRHVEPALRDRYFHCGGDHTAEVNSQTRDPVRFAWHNLVRDPIPPPGEARFDVIVCRNVLIYFDAATAARTASRLRTALCDPGVMVLGASDRLTLPPSELRKRVEHPPERRNEPAHRRVTAPGHRGVVRTPTRPARRLGDGRDPLAQALADADAGRLAAALTGIEPILDADPLNTAALFVQGLVLHAQGNPKAALDSLRRVLYLDPSFVRAAFELGRAQDALGDRPAAHRAYRQALEGLDSGGSEDSVLGQIDEGLADACRVQLAASARETVR